MPDMSLSFTASIMEIMLQAGNVRSSSLPALTHPHSVLLSLSCLHAFQVRGRATREDCSMLHTTEKKNINPYMYFERNTMFSHL